MASAVARAYNGGLRAEPPAGSRSRAPGQGFRGRSRPEAEAFLVFGRSIETPNLSTFLQFRNEKKLDNLFYLCKKIMGGHETGGWSKTGTCAPRSGSRPKSATGT